MTARQKRLIELVRKVHDTPDSDDGVYRIDKGIPLARQMRPARRYPFAEMMPGDSFLVPREGDGFKRRARNATTYTFWWGRKNGRRFATRTSAEGLRIWLLGSTDKESKRK